MEQLDQLRRTMADILTTWNNDQDIEPAARNVRELLGFDLKDKNPLYDAMNLALHRIPGYAIEDQAILATRYLLISRINPFAGDLQEESILLSYLAEEALTYITEAKNPRVLTATFFRLGSRLGMATINQKQKTELVDYLYMIGLLMEDMHGATYLDQLILHLPHLKG